MANKTAKTKHKPVRRALRANEYYNPKTKRYEYHYKDVILISEKLPGGDFLKNNLEGGVVWSWLLHWLLAFL